MIESIATRQLGVTTKLYQHSQLNKFWNLIALISHSVESATTSFRLMTADGACNALLVSSQWLTVVREYGAIINQKFRVWQYWRNYLNDWVILKSLRCMDINVNFSVSVRFVFIKSSVYSVITWLNSALLLASKAVGFQFSMPGVCCWKSAKIIVSSDHSHYIAILIWIPSIRFLLWRDDIIRDLIACQPEKLKQFEL